MYTRTHTYICIHTCICICIYVSLQGKLIYLNKDEHIYAGLMCMYK